MKTQTGFTLIELVIVVVILSILAAFAIPKYTDLSGKAQAAALDGVVGSLASAAAINFPLVKAGTGFGGTTLTTCEGTTTGPRVLLDGGLPSGYTIGAVVLASGNNTCTVTQTATGNTKTFTVTIP